jgi:hypothetical protein
MHDRRSATHAASTAHDPQRAGVSEPGKSTLTGQLPAHAARAVPGGAHNADIDHLNHDHHGMDTARLGESAELTHLEAKRKHAHSEHEKHALDKQIAQLKHDHLGYKASHTTSLYDIEGRPLRPIKAHTPVLINAGTLTKLALNPTATASMPVATPNAHAAGVECVFVFETVEPDGSRISAGGWVPTSALPKAVGTEQHALAKEIRKERGDSHDKFVAQPVAILTLATARTNPPDITDKFTYPKGKQFSKSGQKENQAQDYMANLSLNIPRSGGKRFGVETTRLPTGLDSNVASDPGVNPGHPLDAYHEFYPQEPRNEVAIDLYDKDGTTPAAKMWFVYGYVRTSADAKIYGWINKKMLAP